MFYYTNGLSSLDKCLVVYLYVLVYETAFLSLSKTFT